MNPASGHLTDAQIRDYVTDSTPDLVAQKWLAAHLGDCESCLNRVLEAERTSLGLLEGDGMKRTPYPGCPGEETLQELAAGICDPDIAETTTEHAAHCDYCGPVLSRYMKEFSDDLPAEDAAILGQLKTSTPAWQKKFVRENSPQPKKSWFTFWPKLATAAATIAVAVGIYIYQSRPSGLNKATILVANAFPDYRTMELRLPAESYQPFQQPRQERGGPDNGDWTSKPGRLFEAEAIVKEQCNALDNSQCLEVQGGIQLLSGNHKKAEEDFKQALDKDSGNVNLKIELAAAYFEDAMKTAPEHPDLAGTIDKLTEIVKESKADKRQRAIALFNLAIAYQKSNMPNLARDRWKEYLEIDPNGPWSKEARSRLQELEGKMPTTELQKYINSQDPSFFLANLINRVVLHNLEAYQETALTSWLFPALQNSQTASWQATEKVADLLQQQHSDFWLRDFLSASKSADLRSVRALLDAITDNQRGRYEEALSSASVAAQSLAAQGNTAGELRARYEEVYASRSLMRGHDCLAHSLPLAKRLSGNRYPWLRSQLLLEQAQCENFLADWATMERDLDTTRNLAQKAEFRVLELRIEGISLGIEYQRRQKEAWQHGVEGMGHYWSEAYPVVRLTQFYDVLWQCALDSGNSYTAEALLRGTLELRQTSADIKRNPNLVREGMIHIYLAGILNRRGDIRGADEEKKQGLDLLSQVSEKYPQLYEVVANIEPAESELEQENAERALLTLKPLEGMLRATQDNFFSLRFYRLLGRIYFKLRRFDEASDAFQSAIHIAETSLKTFGTSKDLADWIRAASDSYHGLVRVLLEQQKPEEALARWESYKSRPWLRGAPTSDFDPIPRSPSGQTPEPIFRGVLPPSAQARIVYASFEDGLQIWLYKDGRVFSRWIEIKQKDLLHSTEEFIQQCSTPYSDLPALQKLGQKLYAEMLQPILSELPERSAFVVEPDYPIFVPVGALRDSSGRYVENMYSISYSPGIWMENSLRLPGMIRAFDPLLLVDASHSSNDGTLPGASLEIKAISDSFPHTTIVNSEIQKWETWRSALSTADVFVFLGHGRSGTSGTVLALNSTESIGAKDFAPDLLTHTRLAVLSACSTGVGNEDGLLDTDNLVHSFLSARVPNVIASHWNVDSSTTAKLMGDFYSHLPKEKVAQAMNDAQRAMLHEMPHPYYWAGFTLIGRAN